VAHRATDQLKASKNRKVKLGKTDQNEGAENKTNDQKGIATVPGIRNQ